VLNQRPPKWFYPVIGLILALGTAAAFLIIRSGQGAPSITAIRTATPGGPIAVPTELQGIDLTQQAAPDQTFSPGITGTPGPSATPSSTPIPASESCEWQLLHAVDGQFAYVNAIYGILSVRARPSNSATGVGTVSAGRWLKVTYECVIDRDTEDSFAERWLYITDVDSGVTGWICRVCPTGGGWATYSEVELVRGNPTADRPTFAPGTKHTTNLGFHLTNGWGLQGAREKALEVNTQIIKCVESTPECINYKLECPECTVIVKEFKLDGHDDFTRWGGCSDPAETLDRWIDAHRATLDAISGTGIYIEGPNEFANKACLREFAAFEAVRTRRLAQMGVKSCAGNFAVGEPQVPVVDPSEFNILRPVFVALDATDGLWCSHNGYFAFRWNVWYGPNQKENLRAGILDPNFTELAYGWHTGRDWYAYDWFQKNGWDIEIAQTEGGMTGPLGGPGIDEFFEQPGATYKDAGEVMARIYGPDYDLNANYARDLCLYDKAVLQRIDAKLAIYHMTPIADGWNLDEVYDEIIAQMEHFNETGNCF